MHLGPSAAATTTWWGSCARPWASLGASDSRGWPRSCGRPATQTGRVRDRGGGAAGAAAGTEAACGADAGAAAGEPDRLASDDGRSGDDGGVEAVSTCYAKEARRGLLTPSGPSAGRDLERAANAEVATRAPGSRETAAGCRWAQKPEKWRRRPHSGRSRPHAQAPKTSPTP